MNLRGKKLGVSINIPAALRFAALYFVKKWMVYEDPIWVSGISAVLTGYVRLFTMTG
jgi:hypothetical protein